METLTPQQEAYQDIEYYRYSTGALALVKEGSPES